MAASPLSRLYDDDAPTLYQAGEGRGQTAVHRPPPELLAKLRDDFPTAPPAPSPSSDVRQIMIPTAPPPPNTLLSLYGRDDEEESARLALTNTVVLPGTPPVPTFDESMIPIHAMGPPPARIASLAMAPIPDVVIEIAPYAPPRRSSAVRDFVIFFALTMVTVVAIGWGLKTMGYLHAFLP